MAPPVTIWDSRVDDDDPIAYIYDAAGVIRQRIYRQHTGNDERRQWVWFCTCSKGNQYGAPRIAGDEKRDTRCHHLRRFMKEATEGKLGPGITLTEYGRGVANTTCACNTGRRLEETPIPDRPVGDGMNAKERRAARREAERIEEARAEAERKRAEELEAAWKKRYDERTRMARARIAQVEAEIAAERRKRSAPPAPAPGKKKSPPKVAKKAVPRKAPAKKTSKANPKKREKK